MFKKDWFLKVPQFCISIFFFPTILKLSPVIQENAMLKFAFFSRPKIRYVYYSFLLQNNSWFLVSLAQTGQVNLLFRQKFGFLKISANY